MCARDGHIYYVSVLFLESQDLQSHSIEAVSMARELSLLLVISVTNLLLRAINRLIRPIQKNLLAFNLPFFLISVTNLLLRAINLILRSIQKNLLSFKSE